MALHQKTHPVYVEGCFGCKVSSLRIGYCGQGDQDASRQKRWDRELDLYASAVKQGIQPEGTATTASRAAIDWSEKTGKAYSEETRREHDVDTILERYAV